MAWNFVREISDVYYKSRQTYYYTTRSAISENSIQLFLKIGFYRFW